MADANEPLHLYVHIPYCLHKCHYCDFNSHERASPDWTAYAGVLKRELAHHAGQPAFRGRRIDSIFFGGGTPSLAPAELIEAIVGYAEDLFTLQANTEITLEANPGAADAERFAAFREAGINRLSIGVQSLNDTELRWLERIHDRNEALAAFALAREAGFDNINLDLMYGLPAQPLTHWLDSLRAALDLGPEHLSCYQLTVEPHTRLAASHARSPLPLPDDELALAFFHATREQLQQAGFEAYEVSNFSRPGRQCRHNDGYWLYHDYIGIGAGASGKWTSKDGGSHRYTNIRTPERYIGAVREHGQAFGLREELNRDAAAREAVWLGLRRRDGISASAFMERFGECAWQEIRQQLAPWISRGMLISDAGGLRLAPAGLPLADAIAAEVI